jgi:hypothetical protein
MKARYALVGGEPGSKADIAKPAGRWAHPGRKWTQRRHKFIVEYTEKWGNVIRAAGIKAE